MAQDSRDLQRGKALGCSDYFFEDFHIVEPAAAIPGIQ